MQHAPALRKGLVDQLNTVIAGRPQRVHDCVAGLLAGGQLGSEALCATACGRGRRRCARRLCAPRNGPVRPSTKKYPLPGTWTCVGALRTIAQWGFGAAALPAWRECMEHARNACATPAQPARKRCGGSSASCPGCRAVPPHRDFMTRLLPVALVCIAACALPSYAQSPKNSKARAAAAVAEGVPA